MYARDAYSALVAQLETALASVSPAPVIGVGWPSENLLQNTIAKGVNSVVSLFDLNAARDATRFLLFTANEIDNPTGIVSVVGGPLIPALGNATISLSGTVNQNDAVAAVIANGRLVGAATTTAGSGGATPTTMAAALAAAINADATLSQWVSASANGAAVDLTNLTERLLSLASNVGNIGTRYQEVHRIVRMAQVDVWSPTAAARDTISRLVSGQLSYLDAHFGMTGGAGTDGTYIRVRYLGDQLNDGEMLRDVYRQTFRVSLEYGETYQETIYSVLAQEVTQQVNLGFGDYAETVTVQ